ncbi:hypothetical protein [Streptomyces sp. NPDC003943]
MIEPQQAPAEPAPAPAEPAPAQRSRPLRTPAQPEGTWTQRDR